MARNKPVQPKPAECDYTAAAWRALSDEQRAEEIEWAARIRARRVAREAREARKTTPAKAPAPAPVRKGDLAKSAKELRAKATNRPKGTVPSPVVEKTRSVRPERVMCRAQSVVRHPGDHPDPDLRLKPILDEDGARQYKPCELPAMSGMTVCQFHGGKSPQALAARDDRRRVALEILIQNAPGVAEVLARKALDERMDDRARFQYVAGLLDRVGVRGGMDLNVGVPAWQQMIKEMFEEGSPDRTIDGELADKDPANAESGAEENIRIMEELNAAARAAAAQDEADRQLMRANLGRSAQAGPAVDFGEDQHDKLYGAKPKRGRRVSR